MVPFFHHVMGSRQQFRPGHAGQHEVHAQRARRFVPVSPGSIRQHHTPARERLVSGHQPEKIPRTFQKCLFVNDPMMTSGQPGREVLDIAANKLLQAGEAGVRVDLRHGLKLRVDQ
jgi:hypothetical protein